ncbi:MAG: hypothetical protein ACRDVP_09395 [Acidimicrobiales bacterium]
MPGACTLLCVLAVVAVTLWQLHPSLLLTNTTTTGGDTGAHLIMPAYLRAQLLSHGRLTGWDPGWYDGYPIYTYYFVLPDLLAALASYVIPYGVAFKLMTVLGSVLLPACAWACGRLFGLKPPLPAALAAATLPFLFDYTWTIYGGNLFSTLAGEYAYSFSISLAVLFLGLFARGLRTGRGRGWSAIVLGACVLSHIVPAALALVGAAVLVSMELFGTRVKDDSLSTEPRPLRARIWWGLSTVGLGLALCSWWWIPFLVDREYSTQMGYLNLSDFSTLLAPHADIWALVLAGLGVGMAVGKRSRFGLLLSALGALSAIGLAFDPQGALYNVRLLPLWFLCVYLIAGWFVGTVARGIALASRSPRWAQRDPALAAQARSIGVHRFGPGTVFAPLAVLIAALIAVVPPLVLPADALPVHPGANQVTTWSDWNYSGYESKPAYGEFAALMSTMTKVGREHGCGRAMWEYDANENRFGTPEALMDLPYFTGGCIDSMEGLLFESSATTPYHFLNQAELSVSPSEPMVGLPYGPLDVPLGIEHLKLLGVRYLMAFSPQVVQSAEADPSLRLVAETGPWQSAFDGQLLHTTWDVFQINGSSLVSSLSELPAVLNDVGQTQTSWLPTANSWYDDPNRWSVELAAAGPKSWPRVGSGEAPPEVPVVPAKVSRVVETDSSISFDVARTGSPVLVKTSYFPNWSAQGASGPYRVTPNLMVVVPTAKRVTLTYGEGAPGRLGLVLSGIALLIILGAAFISRYRRRWVATSPTWGAGLHASQSAATPDPKAGPFI